MTLQEINGLRGKRILITGGAGFIGTRLAERLAEDNELILYDRNLDHNCISFWNSNLRHHLTLVHGDILDSQKLAESSSDVDIIIHAAAVVGVRNVITQPRKTLEVNFMGTINLLRASLASKSLERFLYFSTSEVFGNNAFRVTENSLSSFGSAENQRWCYSIGKVAGEHLVQSYHREYGLPTVIVRPFNVFGPGRLGEHAVKIFMMQAIMGKDLVVLGDGSQIRSWCYVDDFIDALLSCLTSGQAVGNSFNIGNPMNTITIYELARKIIGLCDSSSKIVFKKPSYSDIDLRIPDVSKSREVLGFYPKFEMEQALCLTRDWYKQHLDHIPYDDFYDDINHKFMVLGLGEGFRPLGVE